MPTKSTIKFGKIRNVPTAKRFGGTKVKEVSILKGGKKIGDITAVSKGKSPTSKSRNWQANIRKGNKQFITRESTLPVIKRRVRTRLS